MQTQRTATFVSLGVILALTLVTFHSVLDAPGSSLPVWGDKPVTVQDKATAQLRENDNLLSTQIMVANTAHFVAHNFLSTDDQQCFPLHNSRLLGEHLLASSILFAPWYLISGNPIGSFDVLAILAAFLCGLSMYFLVLTLTDNHAAAVVSAILFALGPWKLSEVHHPHLIANYWTPIVFLGVEKLYRTPGWRASIFLATAVALQMLASFYVVVALALGTITYVASLSISQRQRLDLKVTAGLGLSALTAACIALALYVPYLQFGAEWGTLARSAFRFNGSSIYFPGHSHFIGFSALLLTIVGSVSGLIPGFRQTTVNRRFTFFLVGLVGLVLAVGQFRLGSFVVPAVYLHLADLVPGLSAVRVPGQLDTLFHLSICVLAGYGAAFLVRGRWQNLIGAALIALTFSELTVPAIAKTVYGYGEGIRTFAYGPPEGHTEYLRKQAGNDAVLDLPATNGFMRAFVNNPHYVALQAFHHKPVVACRNSFPSPIGKRMDHIFEPWTKHSAIKLAALGIHYVVLHKHAVPLWTRKRPDSLFRLLPFDSALHRVFMDKNADVYRITVSKSTTTTDTGKLSLSLSSEHICETPSTISKVHLIVRNTGTNLWRHPDNIRPLIVAASWKNIGGRPEGVSEVGPTGEIPSMRTAGPLVLLPKEAATIKLGIPLPVNRGHYEAELTVSGMIRPAQRLSLDAQVLEDRSLCATP